MLRRGLQWGGVELGERYLLSCPCGKEVTVEPRQAGEVVRCQCGASLDVPSMTAMRRLPSAETATSNRGVTRPWGPRQQVALIGGLLLVLGLAWVGYLSAQPPSPPVSEPGEIANYDGTLEAITASESWRLWRSLQEPLPDITRKAEAEYFDRVADHRRWMIVGGVIALLGTAMIIAAALWKPT